MAKVSSGRHTSVSVTCPPLLDQLSEELVGGQAALHRIRHRGEQLDIQDFIPESAVEGLHEWILPR